MSTISSGANSGEQPGEIARNAQHNSSRNPAACRTTPGMLWICPRLLGFIPGTTVAKNNSTVFVFLSSSSAQQYQATVSTPLFQVVKVSVGSKLQASVWCRNLFECLMYVPLWQKCYAITTNSDEGRQNESEEKSSTRLSAAEVRVWWAGALRHTDTPVLLAVP